MPLLNLPTVTVAVSCLESDLFNLFISIREVGVKNTAINQLRRSGLKQNCVLISVNSYTLFRCILSSGDYVWIRHFATLVPQFQQKSVGNALTICVILPLCFLVIFSAPLKSSWKSNNFIIFWYRWCLSYICSVQWTSLLWEGRIMWGRAPRLFSHCCIFLDFNAEGFFFLCLTIIRCYCVWVMC